MNNFLYPSETIIVATHNGGKAKEFKKLFGQVGINTTFSKDFNIEEPLENGKTFKDNSIIKVKSAANLNLTAIADDSGLCVDVLDGKPGIFSARWAKKYGGWQNAMEKIYSLAQKKKNSNEFFAKYYCVLSVLWKDGSINCYSGEIKGVIIWPPIGNKGFGYDPFFRPLDSEVTFGQMNKEVKMSLDHRSIAFKKIIRNHLAFGKTNLL